MQIIQYLNNKKFVFRLICFILGIKFNDKLFEKTIDKQFNKGLNKYDWHEMAY